MSETIQEKLQKDAKDLQQKVEEGVNDFKNKLEQGYEITSKFYAEYIERQAVFTGSVIEAGIKNSNSLTSIKSVGEAIQKSTDHVEEITKQYKDQHDINSKAFQSFHAELKKIAQLEKKTAKQK